MMKHKSYSSVENNYWLKRLDTQLNEQTFQIQEGPKRLLRKRIRKRYYKTLGTSVINSPMSPPSLIFISFLG